MFAFIVVCVVLVRFVVCVFSIIFCQKAPFVFVCVFSLFSCGIFVFLLCWLIFLGGRIRNFVSVLMLHLDVLSIILMYLWCSFIRFSGEDFSEIIFCLKLREA